MSAFRWEISEPTDAVESGLQSGVVNLENFKDVSKKPSWRLETPDGTIALVPQSGGEVDLTELPIRVQIRSRLSKGVVNFGLILLISMGGFFATVVGFIMIHDARIGNLGFKDLISTVATLLVGIGLGSRRTNS
jgi:hypothetical protein